MDNDGRLIPFSALISLISERLGIRLHLSTLHRWRSRGIRGRRLKARRLGGRWLASWADVEDFCRDPDADTGGQGLAQSTRIRAAQEKLSSEFRI